MYKVPTLKLGRVVNSRELLTLNDDDLKTHLYIVGASRTGKTKFLENILRQVIVGQRRNGPGLLLLDPHATLYDDLARYLADNAVALKRPVLFLDPSRDDFVVPYNILRRRTSPDGRPAEPSVVARQVLSTMSYIWGEDGTQRTPTFHRMAYNLLLTLYLKSFTTNEAYHFLYAVNKEIRKALSEDIDRPTVLAHWEEINSKTPKDFMEEIRSTLNRFQPLVDQPRLTRMFGHPDRSIDFRRALDEGWIILCNLSSENSQIDEQDGHLLGTLLLADLWATAKDRGKAAGARIAHMRPFVVAIDEVQNFITPTIAKNLSEASGFGLRLIFAHQYPGQLTDDPRHEQHGKLLFKSILTNARNKVVFGGLGHDEDLGPLADVIYRGVLNPDEIKHTLYATKVLDYRLEYERAYGSSDTTTTGGATAFGTASGTSSMRSAGQVPTTSYDNEGNILGVSYSTPQMEAFTSNISQTNVQSSSWTDSHTDILMDVPMLKPVLGKEVSSLQFRDLEEQRYRAMAALYDQKQRQCVIRLTSMKEPVSIFTPFVDDGFSSQKSCDQYIAQSYANWPDLVLRADEATRLVDERRQAIEQQLLAKTLPPRRRQVPRVTLEKKPSPTPMIPSPKSMRPALNIAGLDPQERDYQMLADLYDSRFTTITHAQIMHYGSEAVAKRRLRALANADIIGRREGHFGYTRLYGKPQEIKVIYTFTKKAFDTLVSAGQAQRIAGHEWNTKVRKHFDFASIKLKTIEHEVGMLDVKASMTRALVPFPHLRPLEFGVWPLRYEFGPSKRQPDGFLHLAEFSPNRDDHRSHYFYLEYDHDHNETLDRILEKVAAYADHRRKRGFVTWLGFPHAQPDDHPFRTLFIIDSTNAAQRRDNIAEAIALAASGGDTQTWLTTLSQFLADPLGPIWLTPRAYKIASDTHSPVALLPLFPNLPTHSPVHNSHDACYTETIIGDVQPAAPS